ncbi:MULTISPECIES: hypothetical protein [unclassified Rhizobium]|uniref:hypothetical protein n=1 Tax=unclassified Rhizobium TaxID=2613769 RepID=UPI0006F1FF50|nr:MULTISPECIES: hypothetical protein [unclassified Rhizobium]KQV39200.1 hypothetical protein ASC86_23315 [Rhizobium sp. Root1212]KRD35174.1 hypothetical protein ASE37_21885 [Rhizobium sp. Root268]
MSSFTVETFRRSELERRIEEMIALLDMLDGDPDLEDGGDTEANGDELDENGDERDFSGAVEELPTHLWTGEGVQDAEAMIEANGGARQKMLRFANGPCVPLVYDFRRR